MQDNRTPAERVAAIMRAKVRCARTLNRLAINNDAAEQARLRNHARDYLAAARQDKDRLHELQA